MTGGDASRKTVAMSSTVLSKTFENGSGEAFAASLAVALALWVVNAKLPPITPAARRSAGSTSATAATIKIAPAGTRMNVWIASHALSK